MSLTKDSMRGVARAILSDIQSDNDKARADHVFLGRYAEATITDGGTAATAVTETVIFQAIASPVTVKKARITLPVTAANAASNIATFTLSKRTAGGSATPIAVWATTTGSEGTLTAFTPGDMTITASAVELAKDDVLTIKCVKGASGVAIAAATSAALVQVQLEEGY